jgi:CPA1 family monovalent cation:H+ antiporter
MGEIEFLITLLVAVALLVWVARQLDVPYPIVLVIGGLGLGALPGLPELVLEPEIVFLVFIPPLVHAAGYLASPRHLMRDARPIAMSAVLLVALTIGAVGVAAHALVDELSWTSAFLLATVVAPTDLVAATAVFRRLGAPERIVNLVEGENLVNDGTALTAWRVAVVAALAGSLSAGDVVEELLLVAAGGTALGVLGGIAVAWLRRRLHDTLIEVTVTILTPYVLYVAAEELGLSGILAAVVSGIYLGFRDHELTDPVTRMQAYGFWSVFTFILESLLFVLVGLQFPDVLDKLDRPAGELIAAGLAIAGVVMAVRMAYQFVVPGLATRERLVVGWAGMRGAISLAVALAIPLEIEGREVIIFLTLCVILTTLVVQGLTLPLLIERLRFDAEVPDERRQAMARFRTIEAALERIGELSMEEDGVNASTVERARSLYAQRAHQLAGECRDGMPDAESDTAAWLRLRLDLLGIERARLAQLRSDGQITTPLMNAVQQDLDLEEQRLQRRLTAA